jgi:broad specificity phosphatase PhoE
MMLYLIRHGETEWNTLSKIQGSSDIALNHKGEQEARFLGRFLWNLPLTRIISSDLARALKTARLIANKSVPVTTDPRLRERTFGKYEGLGRSEILAQLKQKYAIDAEQFDPVFDWPDRDEVEPLASVLNRAQAVIHELASEAGDHHLAIVTHGNIVHVLLCWILNIPFNAPRPVRLANCTCVELEPRREKWMVRSLISPQMLDASLFPNKVILHGVERR